MMKNTNTAFHPHTSAIFPTHHPDAALPREPNALTKPLVVAAALSDPDSAPASPIIDCGP